jgi:[glutamine synthetase] adenylyltransferase / [glutamine synthetase]-adenylyl-L-tyrosine phosphorylase
MTEPATEAPTGAAASGHPIDPLARVAGRMARLGFAYSEVAAVEITSEPLLLWDMAANAATDDGAAAIIAALARTAVPDRALAFLAQLAAAGGADGGLKQALGASATLRGRLLGVLGASVGLSEHLVNHPDDWQVLTGATDVDDDQLATDLAHAVGASEKDPITGSAGQRAAVTGPEAVVAIRRAYRRGLLAIAGRDLAGEISVEAVTAALANLAGATLRAGLAVAAAEVFATREPVPFELAVIAMGKTGGRELNYVSDVDVIFVGGPDRTDAAPADDQATVADATQLASRLMRICKAAVWDVDAGLRPEGKDGPLVRTLASHVAYYKRWASTWEFQALLKARPIAGSLSLGEDYVAAIAPMVWTAADRPNFVSDVQAMRRRVVAQLAADVAPREIKLGPGGLRDVEFAIQLLQLVHGRVDESLRQTGTFAALAALRDGGYVGRDDAVSLADAYRFLRTTEHRVQLLRLRRTHLVPSDTESLYRLARAMGFRADHRGDARAVWESEWALHVREVRRLHEKLFYRPLLESVARVPSDTMRLSPEQAERRLAALGFTQPKRALQHLQALTAGLSRRAAIQRALLPVLLGDFSAAPDPDAGLLRYRRVSDTAGDTPWYLRTLRDEGKVADRLAYLLGTSQYVADLLVAAPDALVLLGEDDGLRPRTTAEVATEMRETAHRQDSVGAAVRAIRAVRRTELVRIASADLLGVADARAIGAGLSDTMDATISVALETVAAAAAAIAGTERAPARLAVIAVGRLGGRELGYGSDADVLFVYEPADGVPIEVAARFADDVAARLRGQLGKAGGDPPVEIDANLRPEGRDGPLARSLASYATYYARWSSIWERHALLRARFAAGDPDVGERFIAMIDPLRYPADGIGADELREIRRLKARIDSERLPRGADAATHTKLGRGGLGDVEWTVQLLQLRHAHAVQSLRCTGTLDALAAASTAGLIPADDAERLVAAWTVATRARNAILLVTGKPNDQLPGVAAGSALVGVGRAMGYPAGFEAGQLDDDYRRTARRARRVVEQFFYADAPS